MHVSILTTGGTIEKSYDETDGTLRNVGSVLETIISALRLPDLEIRHVSVMSKDSLDMTEDDRRTIARAVELALPDCDAVIIVHGTDTLELTGDHLHRHLTHIDKPVILTGAMRPYEFRDTDAYQNLTEALLACRLASPGIYVSMHNKLLNFPGVVKDRVRRTFVRIDDAMQVHQDN